MAASGSQVLRELDQGLSSMRQELRSLDAAVQDSGRSIRKLGGTQLSLYKSLAEHRLEQLERGDIISRLDSVSSKVQGILEERERKHRALLDAINDAESRLEDLEQQRLKQAAETDAAAESLDEREAEAQQQLENDERYSKQLELAHEMEAIADEAETKTADASDDKARKGTPYEADKLFMYLWRRGYGTSEYSANPISRMLDKWVARLCQYDKARPNYWMLNEIPKRLKAHADRARERSDAEFEKLKKLEMDVAESMGVVKLQEELDDAEQSLASLDESIADTEARLSELGDDRARFATGDDELMTRALERLTNELKSDSIESLRRRAAATDDLEDDRLVEQIYTLDRKLDLLEDEHGDRQKIYARQLEKARELEGVRQQFKRHGYDDRRSVFRDVSAVALALKQFLGGMLDDDDLWRIIDRMHRVQRTRAQPDFGSGGFPNRKGTWRIPRSGPVFPRPRLPRRGGFRFPTGGRAGRRRRGGFTTGGGF